MLKPNKPSYLKFDPDSYPWKSNIDYRNIRINTTLARAGRVLICEPYKSEIGIHWRFKNPEIATESSEKIFDIFLAYQQKDDFVGADMARKYLQTGFTRARRYANYRGGKKYDKKQNYGLLDRRTGSEEKARSAEIFYKAYKLAEANPYYKQIKKQWKSNKG